MSIHVILVVAFVLVEVGAAVGAKIGNLNLMAAGLVLFGASLLV